MTSEKLKASAFGIQFLATLCLSFMACQTGFVSAWPSYTLEKLKSNTTVLSAPFTTLDESLIGALPNLGAFIGTPLCGYAFNILGRKNATVLSALPFLAAWLIISLTKSVYLIHFAFTIAGIGIAGQNISLIFISEISHDSIRGGMTACSATGYFIGILFSYTIGGYLSYYQVVYTHLTLSAVCICSLMMLKESPAFLVLVGKEEEAAHSIAYYNRVKVSSELVKTEIKKIKLQLDPRLEKILEGEGAAISDELIKSKLGEVQANNEPSWKILKNSKSSKRALIRVLIIIALTVMMGSIVLQVYAEPLFQDAVPSLSSNLCAIFLAVDFTVASLACVVFIDRFGRKLLLIVTSTLSGVCTLLLGTQLIYHWAPQWFTALLIYLYSFVYTVGCAVIPFVLAAEVFLPEVRSLCNSICMSCVWLNFFITLFLFNPLVKLLGLGAVFCFFSAICFLGALYTHWKLPETRGLSVDAIQHEFLKR